MPKPKIHGGKTNQSGAPQKICQGVDHAAESRPIVDRITTGTTTPSELRPIINYVLGGSFDDKYQSKCQQKKLLRAATVKALVDDPISFPPVNSNKVIMPHYDALVLTLCISSFDVNRVLVDPGSAVDLLQLLAFNQMNLSS